MTAANAASELRELIRSKISDDMSADQAASAVVALFYEVRDDWDEIDITSLGEGPPGTKVMRQRWIVARAPRDVRTENRAADRSVG